MKSYFVSRKGILKIKDMQIKLMEEREKELEDLARNLDFQCSKTLFENQYYIQEKNRIIGKYNSLLIKTIPSDYVIIEEMREYQEFDDTTVIFGAYVEIEQDGEIETYQILGNDEGDIVHNIISCNAPLSVKLLGKKVGDEFEFLGSKIRIRKVYL